MTTYPLISSYTHNGDDTLQRSPEGVTSPEQGKSSGRIATFSLWTIMFWDGISTVPDETVIPQ